MEALPEVYPLTGLQIGDIQSYVSRAFLYFAPSSSRFLILVDNRPWLINKLSRSAKIWQLMVTKYRISPFTNTRALRKASKTGIQSDKNAAYNPNLDKTKRFYQWLPAIDSAKWQEKYLLSSMDLIKALHGFLIFEVAWKDVHGINYLNELLTDTSLALEVKSMKKWEFNSPEQALRCLSLWFSGRASDIPSLEKTLRNLPKLDTEYWEDQPSAGEVMLHKKSTPDVLSDDDFLDVLESPFGMDDEINFIESCSEGDMKHGNVYGFGRSSEDLQAICGENKQISCIEMDDESTIGPNQYADTLILFRFDDSTLPFKIRQIIMSDLRLLTLLEAGLPSWVIFFQSYPLFCHFYRPWMRHLVRSLYILISLVTVIIGFYDLYKNVPLLKTTASRLCGPLFQWIEGWDMVSRIGYLGTMLFLQNLEKGYKWFRITFNAARAITTAISRPLSGPLSAIVRLVSPMWKAYSATAETITSMAWFMIESMSDLFFDLVEVVIWPFELLYLYIWSIAMTIHLFVCYIWGLFLVPVRCTFQLANYTASLLRSTYGVFKGVWVSAGGISQFKAFSEAKEGANEISIWRGLWNDLFSQIFRATRSIINVLAAFFMTCNRHRLSIYNYVLAFLQRLARLVQFAPQTCHCRQKPQIEHHMENYNYGECDRCK